MRNKDNVFARHDTAVIGSIDIIVNDNNMGAKFASLAANGNGRLAAAAA